MIRFFYNLAPNPMKVALFLEEAGLPYEAVPVDTRKGEQHLPAYTAVNPNAKCPALVDGDTTIFDSNAIVLYLAEKTGRFLPAQTPAARGEMLSWLMFIASGIGPYSGQSVHFRHFAPEPKAYALNRYDFEAWRHWRLIDERLSTRRFMLATTTRWWTSRCGVGRVWCHSCWAARTPGRSCQTLNGGWTKSTSGRQPNASRR